MALQRVYQVSCASVPYFASTIVAASNELISILVEATICQGQHMTLQFLDQYKLLVSLFVNLLNEFCMV